MFKNILLTGVIFYCSMLTAFAQQFDADWKVGQGIDFRNQSSQRCRFQSTVQGQKIVILTQFKEAAAWVNGFEVEADLAELKKQYNKERSSNRRTTVVSAGGAELGFESHKDGAALIYVQSSDRNLACWKGKNLTRQTVHYPGTHDYIGAIENRWSHRELRTVFVGVGSERDTALTRLYDVYEVDTKSGMEVRIAERVAGSAIYGVLASVLCPIESMVRSDDCSSSDYFPVLNEMAGGLAGLPCALVGITVDLALLPLRAPVVASKNMKYSRLRLLARALLNNGDLLNKVPTYKLKYAESVNGVRFALIRHKLKQL